MRRVLVIGLRFEKVTVHYSYNKTTKQYFDVEVWEGWSYK